jgi:uncharacterized Zn finger protein
MTVGDYTHCPHCGTLLLDRGWCRSCGDIESLDEFQDANRKDVITSRDDNPHLSAVDFAVKRLLG